MAVLYQPLPQHCDIFSHLLDLYRAGRELVLHRRFDDLGYMPWMNIRVIVAHENCARTRFFVYKPNIPFPLLSTCVVKCTESKLVLQGKMVYHRPKYPDKFTLKLRRGRPSQSWFDGDLNISGNASIALRVFHEQCQHSVPERAFLKFEFKSEHVQRGDQILYDNTIGLFRGWHSERTNQICVDFNGELRYPLVNRCSVVFSHKFEHPRSIEEDASSSSAVSSDSGDKYSSNPGLDLIEDFGQLHIN